MEISQKVAILVDGNNIGISAKQIYKKNLMLDFDNYIQEIVGERQLSHFFYFREGTSISKRFSDRLRKNFYGIVIPCYKSADSVLTINAIQICEKVNTIILFSGDQDYLSLIRYLKSKGTRVELASFDETTAKILLNEVDYHHQIKKENLFEFKENF